MKKLSRPVKASWYLRDSFFYGDRDRICASQVRKGHDCYIVPAALWRKAQAALKAAKGRTKS